MEVKVLNSKVEIVQGDLSEQDTTAVVNAANNHLWMGSGVAGALKKKGGESIEQEAIEQGPTNIGNSVLTKGGDLKARYVIHAVSMGQDMKTNIDYVAKATRSALQLADEEGIGSVSFPAIGAGAGGLEMHQVASTMLTQTIDHLQSDTSIRLVRFVLFDEKTHEAFNDELRHMFARN
ncbi:MAG TPA: macro domain-containing protein [bacterium]|nr:macro domain-containing protein [bacterium]